MLQNKTNTTADDKTGVKNQPVEKPKNELGIITGKQDSIFVRLKNSMLNWRFITIGLLVLLLLASIAVAAFIVVGRQEGKSADKKSTDNTRQIGVDFQPDTVDYTKTESGQGSTSTSVKPVQNTDKSYINFYGEAIVDLEDGNYAAAVTNFEKAAATPGAKSSSFYSQMALAYVGAGSKDKAVAAIKQAKEIYNTRESSDVPQDEKQAANEGFDAQIKELSR